MDEEIPTRDELIEDMVKPRLTFHGTPRHLAASVVRYGFMLPGTTIDDGKLIASPRSGISWLRRGIYSSPQSSFALSFSQAGGRPVEPREVPGWRLFVCATLMGRTLIGAHDYGHGIVHGPLQESYDAHMTSNKLEVIVHRPEDILPCYVVHLDSGAPEVLSAMKQVQHDPWAFIKRRARRGMHPKLNQEWLAPGDKQRLQEAKLARAAKFLPFGYGPGKNCVIEEIGETSDDEENWGWYQHNRHMEEWEFEEQERRWKDEAELEELKKQVEGTRVQDGVIFLDEYAAARLIPNDANFLQLRPSNWQPDI